MIVVGLVVGLGIAGRAAYSVVGDSWQGLASLRWSQTQGVVVQTGLDKWFGRGGYSFVRLVIYRYNVNGREFQNNRIGFPNQRVSGDESIVMSQLNSRYPVGGPCTVYYNPKDPSQSCLEPGVNLFFMVFLGVFSVVFLAVGVLCALYGIRELRHGPPSGP